MEEPKFTKPQYLDLWKYFSEDTAKIKDKLWTIASWLYALMSGLMAFMVDDKAGDFRSLMGLVGVLLSIYTCFMIYEYSKHIKSGWRITDHLVTKIIDLEDVFESTKLKTNGDNPPTIILLYLLKVLKMIKIIDGENINSIEANLPSFAQRLTLLAIGYGVIFGTLTIIFSIKSLIQIFQ